MVWVYIVTGKLAAFTGVSKEEQNAISAYTDKHHPLSEKLNPSNRSFGNHMDYHKGYESGEGVELQHGVGVHSQGSLLLRDTQEEI